MKEGFNYGDPVWVAGSTGKRLPGTLVGETKVKAKVKIWKASQDKYGPIQTYPWAAIEKSKVDHPGGTSPGVPETISFI